MFSFITVLKAFACLLITNFHFDLLYPDKLSILAIGGDLGNNLFFAISGFTLFVSVKKSETKYGKWIASRLMKLLPTVLFVELISVLSGASTINEVSDVIATFIYPTVFWFTGAIIIFYFIYYPFCKVMIRSHYLIVPLAAGLALWHILSDGLWVERYLCGFMAMAIGAFLRLNIEENKIKKNSIVTGISIIVLFAAYCVLKIMRMRGIGSIELIHLGIGVSTIMISAMAILFGFSLEIKINEFFKQHEKTIWISFLTLLANLTLQVYLVQGFYDRILIQTCAKIIFPVNYIICLAIILVLSYTLKKGGDFVNKYLFVKEK